MQLKIRIFQTVFVHFNVV